jgi:hypothetical protein
MHRQKIFATFLTKKRWDHCFPCLEDRNYRQNVMVKMVSLLGIGLGGDGSSVQPENLPGEAQPDSRTASFGGEKGNENLINYIVQNARSIVGHLDGGPSPFVIESSDDDPPVFDSVQGLHRIFYQVDKHLLDHLLIDLYLYGFGLNGW